MGLLERLMESTWLPILGIGLLVVGFCLIIFGLVTSVTSLETIACKQFAEANHLEYQFQIPVGCLVKYQNNWISPDNIRIVPQ